MKPRNRQTADLVYADEVPVGGTSIEDIDTEHFTTFFAKQFGEPLKSTDNRPTEPRNRPIKVAL